MKKYLIGIDLDGTLLTSKETINKESESYLKALQRDGHKLVLATGRPLRACQNYYQQLDLTTPLICDNGSSIYQMNDPHFKTLVKTIAHQDLKSIFRFCKEFLVMGFYNVGDYFYSYQTENFSFPFFHITHSTKVIKGDLDNPNYLEPVLIMLAIDSHYKKEFENYLAAFKTLNARFWGEKDNIALFEVYQNNFNKGNALLTIAHHLNHPQNKIITFGDGANDFELLAVANHGVCMINGREELKKTTKNITNHNNDNNGVINYLKTFFAT